MNRGVPTLGSPHKLCEKGKPLTSEQAQLLKLIGEKMVVFRVQMKARWSAATGEVVEVKGAEAALEEVVYINYIVPASGDGGSSPRGSSIVTSDLDELSQNVVQNNHIGAVYCP